MIPCYLRICFDLETPRGRNKWHTGHLMLQQTLRGESGVCAYAAVEQTHVDLEKRSQSIIIAPAIWGKRIVFYFTIKATSKRPQLNVIDMTQWQFH